MILRDFGDGRTRRGYIESFKKIRKRQMLENWSVWRSLRNG